MENNLIIISLLVLIIAISGCDPTGQVIEEDPIELKNTKSTVNPTPELKDPCSKCASYQNCNNGLCSCPEGYEDTGSECKEPKSIISDLSEFPPSEKLFILLGENAPSSHVILAINIIERIGEEKIADKITSNNYYGEIPLISLGSACVNPKTSELLGNPTQCNKDLKDGIGRIILKDDVIIVDGYGLEEMKAASLALTSGDLTGEKVCITFTDNDPEKYKIIDCDESSLCTGTLCKGDCITRDQCCTDQDCGEHETCIQTTHKCECESGYEKKGTSCQKKTETIENLNLLKSDLPSGFQFYKKSENNFDNPYMFYERKETAEILDFSGWIESNEKEYSIGKRQYPSVRIKSSISYLSTGKEIKKIIDDSIRFYDDTKGYDDAMGNLGSYGDYSRCVRRAGNNYYAFICQIKEGNFYINFEGLIRPDDTEFSSSDLKPLMEKMEKRVSNAQVDYQPEKDRQTTLDYGNDVKTLNLRNFDLPIGFSARSPQYYDDPFMFNEEYWGLFQNAGWIEATKNIYKMYSSYEYDSYRKTFVEITSTLSKFENSKSIKKVIDTLTDDNKEEYSYFYETSSKSYGDYSRCLRHNANSYNRMRCRIKKGNYYLNFYIKIEERSTYTMKRYEEIIEEIVSRI